MPGQFYRSSNGLNDFIEGPVLFNKNMRHSALVIRENLLHVFWTQAGDSPERIYMSSVDVSKDWMSWKESEPVEVLRPQKKWEGAELEVSKSKRGHINERVNQLRDPAIYEENGKVYLLYAVAGEHGIAITEIQFNP